MAPWGRGSNRDGDPGARPPTAERPLQRASPARGTHSPRGTSRCLSIHPPGVVSPGSKRSRLLRCSISVPLSCQRKPPAINCTGAGAAREGSAPMAPSGNSTTAPSRALASLRAASRRRRNNSCWAGSNFCRVGIAGWSTSTRSVRWPATGISAKAPAPAPWASTSTSAKTIAQRRRDGPNHQRHRHQPIPSCTAATKPDPPTEARPAKARSLGNADAPKPSQNKGPLANSTSASPQPPHSSTALLNRQESSRRASSTQRATKRPPAAAPMPSSKPHRGRLSGKGTPIQSRG